MVSQDAWETKHNKTIIVLTHIITLIYYEYKKQPYLINISGLFQGGIITDI